MTFKELLNSVQFEDVAPHIVRMYPDMENALGWYKIHFDMLRLMQPVFDEDANDKVCKITMNDYEEGSGQYLDAYSMECDYWEHSLTKELIIAPDVKATNEEIAACCLWHTSFYGFFEKDLEETCIKHRLIRDDSSYKARAMRNFGEIRKRGGIIPTIRQLSKSKKAELVKRAKKTVWYGETPMNRHKRKKQFRHEFMEHYYKRMIAISDFIVHAMPALNKAGNHMSVAQLCGLFHSELFGSEEIMSFASHGESGAKYLYDLLSSYDMVPKMDGIVVRLVTGSEHEVLTEDEIRLCNMLAEGRKYCDVIFDYDPSLGNQVVISYAAYNSNNPLVK